MTGWCSLVHYNKVNVTNQSCVGLRSLSPQSDMWSVLFPVALTAADRDSAPETAGRHRWLAAHAHKCCAINLEIKAIPRKTLKKAPDEKAFTLSRTRPTSPCPAPASRIILHKSEILTEAVISIRVIFTSDYGIYCKNLDDLSDK